MAVTISRPKISRRPDILDNGKQRLNPDTGRPVWIPQICVKMESNEAAPKGVCVTIYRVRRRNNEQVLEEVCTQHKVLPPIVNHPLGSMTTIIEVCCDLDFVPEEGAEFIAAWNANPPPPPPCVKVPLGRDNRSPRLRVEEVLDLYSARALDEGFRHSAIVGVGMEDAKPKAPKVLLASALPRGWELNIEAKGQPKKFPAVIPFSIMPPPGAFLDEVAEVKFRVVDKDGFELDEVSYRFHLAAEPDANEAGSKMPAGSRTGHECNC